MENMTEQELDSLLLNKKSENLIKYGVSLNLPKDRKPLEISFEDVDNYDFKKGFTEYLISEDHVHLYFDFDTIQNIDEFDDVCEWLNKVSEVFGPYSYGGYCNNEEMEEIGFRRYDEGGHYLSMYVVFYETAISTIDLQTIMKHTEEKGFVNEGIHPLCDHNVYKLVSKKDGETTRQLFRHVLADKMYTISNKDGKNEAKHGYICEGKKPSTQIVQIRGNERVIVRSEWEKLFTIKKVKREISKEPEGMKEFDDALKEYLKASLIGKKNSDLNVNNELIILNDEEMNELLSEFEPTYDVFTKIVSNLMHSPYSEDDVKRLIENWYFKGEHQNKNTIDLYVDKYYEKIENNKWFYSIIKHLPKEKRSFWIDKFIDVGIDVDEKIDLTDAFSLRDIRTNDYSVKGGGGVGVQKNRFINDLKKCVTVINSAEMLFIVKDYDGVRDTTTLSFLNDKGFEKLMKSIKVGKYEKDNKVKPVNAFMIYDEGKNKNYLMKDGMRFYDERENIFSYFNGYDYEMLKDINYEKISGFLNHVKEVIAKDNEELYEFILNWYAYILQNPAGKTESVLLITGKQGTGKNVFTNVLCELMNKYADRNITNLDSVVGKFNAAIENMKLIVCNELSSVETNKFLNHDILKSIITEKETNINQKNMPVRKIENVVNLIMVSNNFDSVKIEQGDRRYVVIEVSDKYKGDHDYFDKLCGSFDKEFYDNLITFFMKRDLNNFNLRKLPHTDEKEELIEMNKTCYQLFVEEYDEEFAEGWICRDCYQAYARYAKENGYNVCASNTFGKKMRDFVERKRVRIEGSLQWVYFKKGT